MTDVTVAPIGEVSIAVADLASVYSSRESPVDLASGAELLRSALRA